MAKKVRWAELEQVVKSVCSRVPQICSHLKVMPDYVVSAI